jgi:5-(carboxyamino)imidazole ribonucleotide synthase
MIKIGILGGGQLGRMFLQNALRYPYELHILDPDPQAPCSGLTTFFTNGKLTDYQTVIDFGKNVDVLTVEIENINVEALENLEKQGVKVFPQPNCLRIIQDKCLQKAFFKEHNIPTSEFLILENKTELIKNKDFYINFLPAFQKLAKEGYDGKGVQLLETEQDFSKSFETKSLLEKKVNVWKEISVMVARNSKGEVAVYEPVEMVFDPKLNLVDYLFAPQKFSNETIKQKAQKLALEVIEKMQMIGILAVEMFVEENGNILVNEVAPRPHNSGHHTIEACFTSQFDQHLRAIMNLPLGNTSLRSNSGMLNLIGEAGFEGNAHYEGLEEVLALPNVYIHLYGKQKTKSGRKMGHITVLGNSEIEIIEKIQFLKKSFRVIVD